MENLSSSRGEWSHHVPVVCMFRHPRGSYMVHRLLYLEVATPEKQAPQALLTRMQLTLHATRRTPHGASRLVRATSAWSVKARHAPVPALYRCKRFYGHTTMHMHGIECTSRPDLSSWYVVWCRILFSTWSLDHPHLEQNMYRSFPLYDLDLSGRMICMICITCMI